MALSWKSILVGLCVVLGLPPEALAAAPCVRPTRPPFAEAAYYAPAQGLTGKALELALNDIIDGHTDYTYGCVWTILKEIDEDPANPANVIGFYGRRSIPKALQDAGANTPDYWNREHVWAHSHGFPNGNYHAYTDVHQLRAADKSINADRGNKDFAYGGVPHGECQGCRSTATTWEAPDVVKGEVARIMFYMATRYDGDDGNGTPDLELVDSITSTGTPRFGDLCDLVQWHLADPVSAEERARNEAAWVWQGNRNPFVDHPEYVLPIWGETCGIPVPEPEPEGVAVPLPLWTHWAFGLIALARARYGRNSHRGRQERH